MNKTRKWTDYLDTVLSSHFYEETWVRILLMPPLLSLTLPLRGGEAYLISQPGKLLEHLCSGCTSTPGCSVHATTWPMSWRPEVTLLVCLRPCGVTASHKADIVIWLLGVFLNWFRICKTEIWFLCILPSWTSGKSTVFGTQGLSLNDWLSPWAPSNLEKKRKQ